MHGTITLLGPENDTVEDVELEVVQGGSVVATGTLASSAQSSLLQQFGTDNEIVINSSQHLFDLNPGGINSAANGQLSLRVKVRTDSAEEATKDSGNVTILKRYTGTDRYGQRDINEGGDDWAIPGVADFIDGLTGYQWGDFSNMNAGAFAPHSSHRTGVDVDGWFNGYNARDANAANIIVDEINNSNGRINLVFVTYAANVSDAFYAAIQNVILNDGRAATSVIRPARGHRTHFHYRITEN